MLLSLLVLVAPSHADVAPGPVYVEACPIEKLEQDGTTCESCRNGMSSADTSGVDPCEAQFEGRDFEYVCQTWGASSWTEIWCDGPTKQGCGCAAGGPGTASWVVGALLVGILVRRPRGSAVG